VTNIPSYSKALGFIFFISFIHSSFVWRQSPRTVIRSKQL
jgi:hypothetical protein